MVRVGGGTLGVGRLAGLVSVGLFLSGCAVVRIYGPDGSVDIQRYPLTLRIEVADAQGPQAIRASSLGLVRTSDGFVLGFRSEERVLIPPGCHAVMIVRSEAEFQAALRLTPGINEECLIVHD